MFKNFKYADLEMIYMGLKALIESGSGYGFHNADMGHPAYRIGATGKVDEKTWGDGPNENRLFQMISELSKKLKSKEVQFGGFAWWYDFSEWKDFCKFAVEVYDKKKGISK